MALKFLPLVSLSALLFSFHCPPRSGSETHIARTIRTGLRPCRGRGGAGLLVCRSPLKYLPNPFDRLIRILIAAVYMQAKSLHLFNLFLKG